jgi:hypothetical protein
VRSLSELIDTSSGKRRNGKRVNRVREEELVGYLEPKKGEGNHGSIAFQKGGRSSKGVVSSLLYVE